MRNLCKRESDDANVAMRPPGGMSKMFREDHSDGGKPTIAPTALCHLPSQDPPSAAGAETGFQ